MVKYMNVFGDTADGNMDEALQDILKMRHIPQPSSNLSERIIDASLYHRKQGRSGPDLWARTFWDAFLLPKPAYVLAAVFMVGIAFGVYGEFVDVLLGDAEGMSAFLYTAEDVAEGDWL